jgi:hypothetical protein
MGRLNEIATAHSSGTQEHKISLFFEVPIIENQVAMGDATVVPATLDRQDAVHEFP